jgi:aspartate/methionine/tyrosine aminotransferase
MPMGISLFGYIRSLPEDNINMASSGMKGINPEGNGIENVEDLVSRLYGVKSNNVMITPSGTFASFFTLFYLRKKIRRMITITPEYPVFYYQAKELGYEVEIENRLTDDGIELSPWDVEENAAYFLSNPNNPSGLIWSDESLRSIARETEGNDSYLIVDDTFSFFTSTFSKKMDIGNNIMIGSMSKFFGDSGIKMGWIVARDSIIQEMSEMMDIIVPDISLAVRRRAHYLLSNMEMYKDYNTKKLKANYAVLKENLGDYLVDSPAQIINALYVNENSLKFSQSLLKEGVSSIPGIFFGSDNIIRICIGTEEQERIERGAKIISRKLVNGKQ